MWRAHCANSVTGVIKGAHTVLFAHDPEAARAFLQTVLGLESVDAGNGWLIFALPPTELACHPAEPGGSAELYLMCENLDETRADLQEKGAKIGPAMEERWGRIAPLTVPGFGEIGLYEPRHASPLDPFRT